MFQAPQKIIVKPELRGFFWIYLLTSLAKLAISLLVMLVLLLIVGGIAAGISAGKDGNIEEKLTYETISGNSANKILVYNLNGAILSGKSGNSFGPQTSIYTENIEKDFKMIASDSSIKNIVFKFNSPGGEVFASQVLGDQINTLINKKNIKEAIYYFDSISASGALLASYKTPNYIVGSPYGETGSIGVRLSLPNYQKLADNIGYKEIVIKAGANKDVGNPLRDPNTEEYAYLQSMVDKTYNDFVNIVATGRKTNVEEIKKIANGFTYFNEQAKEYKLIDEVGDIDLAIKKSADNLQLNDYQVVTIKQPTSPFSSLGFVQGNVLNFLGLSTNSIEKINNTFNLKSGTTYAIDENRL